MTFHLYPVLFGLFVWWSSTVLIVYLDGLPQKTFKWSLIGATVVLAASLWGLWASARSPTVGGAYAAFASGVFAWGWQEISFYMGAVTGPRKQPCPQGCSGWAHFVHAIQTSLWHELAIIGSAVAIAALTWGQPNQIGLWTFLVLWWMHQSAKLNVFLGVRNLQEEFLPEHLTFLKSFLTKKPMNMLFPFSVTISTVITAWLVARALAPGASPFIQAGFTFLAAFMAFAVLEHWLLVLPVDATKVFAPGLKSRKGPSKPFDAEVVAGFLGAGKTTMMRRLLAEADPAVKTVVLVNDFGELGLDGARLSGQGAEVVELPNGCICCSLKADLGNQLKDIVGRLSPDRVLIEPSGVADVASLLAVLNKPDIAPMLRKLEVTTLVDAGAFLEDHARLPDYFRAQARLSPTILVSKTDLATAAQRRLVEHTLRDLNPSARIGVVHHGVVTAGAEPAPAQPSVHAHAEPDHGHDHAGHDHAHGHDNGHGHGHGERVGHGHDALGFVQWSGRLTADAVSVDVLETLLEALADGAYGPVRRAKGLVRAPGGWIAFDLAGGRVNLSAWLPAPGEAPRAAVIGPDLDLAAIEAAFAALGRPAQTSPVLTQAA